MRLAVFSHKPCWRAADSPTGIGTDGGFPFQMQALSELFDETILLVPCLPANPSFGETPVAGRNLVVVPLSWLAGRGLRRKLLFPFWLLQNLPKVAATLWSADAVHAPIPGDVGTVGMVGALMLRKPLFVRHCGNWFRPKTTAERLWKWAMERFAGGKSVMLATGGAERSPSARNPKVKWIFSTSLRRDQIASLGSPRSYPNGKSVRLVTAGRQDRDKGTGLVIEALARIHRQFPAAMLEVLGDGRNLPLFREKAASLGLANAVNFHGYVNHDQVLETMKEGDLFCFPTSASEGFPKVVLEAMACGLPVVTTAVSVLPQLVGDKCGVILKSPTPDSVAESVCSVLGSAQKYESMSRRAVEIARQYSLEAWRDQIGALLLDAWGPLTARHKSAVRPSSAVLLRRTDSP